MNARKYQYTNLADTDPKSNESYNIYGVLVDATYPYKSSNDKFLCSMKIVDPTYHLIDDEDADSETHGCCSVIIFAKRLEDLPVVKRIGDIIRIHRAGIKVYKDIKQFNVNVFYNSSWCLFSANLENPEEDTSASKKAENFDSGSEDELSNSKKKQLMPYKYSGKSFSIDQETFDKLQELREWTKDYFSKNEVIYQDMYTLLNKCEMLDKNDFDLLCKIVKVVEKDEYTYSIKVKDLSNEVWQLCLDKIKYTNLRQGEIVRIRSAGVKDGDKKELELRYHSNVLRFVRNSKIVNKLKQQISDADTSAQNINTSEEIIRFPAIVTNINEKYADMKVTSFFDLLHNENFDLEEQQSCDKEMEVEQDPETEPKEEMDVDEEEEKISSSKQNKTKNNNSNSDSEDNKEDSKDSITPSKNSKSNSKNENSAKIKEDGKGQVKGEKKYRVRFYTLAYEPKDLREAVRAVCPECMKDFSLKDLGKKSSKGSAKKASKDKKNKDGIKCNECDVDCELNYKIKLMTKDTSTSKNKYLYSVLLYSRPGKGDEFFKDIKPCNLYENDEAYDKLSKYMKILTKFNVHVDGIVKKENNWMILNDTNINFDITD